MLWGCSFNSCLNSSWRNEFRVPWNGHLAAVRAGCPLVKARGVRYFLTILRKIVSFSALAFCVGAQAVTSDMIQLKDNAAISGKILTE
jgi:hypothetical protein